MMTDKNEVWRRYKESILSQLTFHDIYGQIKNQKDGTDSWVTGLCPFHNDKHSSFAFNKKTLAWACFAGCGKGSAFDFIMHSSGRSFKDTLLELGDKLNIPRPFQKQIKRPPIKEELVKQWANCLNEEVRRYLREKRGLTGSMKSMENQKMQIRMCVFLRPNRVIRLSSTIAVAKRR